MKKIQDLKCNGDSVLNILMIAAGVTSKKIEPFSKNELQTWLFPLSLEKPELVNSIIINFNKNYG
jgi:hypothetical protein